MVVSATPLSASSLTKFQSIARSGNSVDLKYDEGWARITAYDAGIFRVEAGPMGTKPKSSEGYAVVSRKWPNVRCSVCRRSRIA